MLSFPGLSKTDTVSHDIYTNKERKNINDREINGHIANEFEKCTETIVSDASQSKWKAKSYGL